MSYDPVNNQLAPQLYGFSAGTSYDSTTIEYVGYGNSTCGARMPAYVSVANPAGAYLSCPTGKEFDNLNAYFLLKNPNLQWVSTNTTNLYSVQNMIAPPDQNTNLFGRYLYNNQYQVGRIYVGGADGGFYFINENNGQSFSANFEVLVCGPQQTTQATTSAAPEVPTTTVEAITPAPPTPAPTTTAPGLFIISFL